MKRHETPEDVKSWFFSEIVKLWPVAGTCLSLRKNRCTRKHCSACLSGEGHPYYALQFRKNGRQTSLFIPDYLAEHTALAVENERKLRELAVEAGVRYLKALKFQRKEAKG